MPRVIITAQVEDSKKWEELFRTHGDLAREETATAIHFSATDNNEVAIYQEVENLNKYFEVLESAATAEAMAGDGVKRDTVKIFVLDKELDL